MNPEEMKKGLNKMEDLTLEAISTNEKILSAEAVLNNIDQAIFDNYDKLTKDLKLLQYSNNLALAADKFAEDSGTELKTLENKAARSDADNEKINELKEKIDSFEKTSTSMKALVEKLAKEIKESEKTINHLLEKRDITIERLVDLDNTINRNKDEFNKISSELLQHRDTATRDDFIKLGKAARANKQEIAVENTRDIRPLMKETEPDKYLLSKGRNQLDQEIKISNGRLRDIRNQKTSINLSHVEIATKEEAIKVMDQETSKIHESLAEMKNARDYLNKGITELNAAIKTDKKELSEVKSQISTLKKENKNMEKYIKKAENNDKTKNDPKEQKNIAEYKALIGLNKNTINVLNDKKKLIEKNIQKNEKHRDELKYGTR